MPKICFDSDIDGLASAIQSSPKYRALCPATIRDVALREIGRHANARATEAAVRQRLHRLWAQFLGKPNYDQARADLDAAFADGSDDSIRAACRRILERHASTRERLDDLPELYRRLFAVTGVPGSVLDLASALHPFGLRWMGLPQTVHYRAFDINADIVALTDRYFRLEGLDGIAEHRDVLCDPPTEPADLALLLKMFHCLEHRRRGAGWEVVAAAPARSVAISFPTHNLTRRRVDIAQNYESEILAGCEKSGWRIERCEVPSETVLVIRKP